ncbi:TIGR01244 family protein [Tateyamaria omphalii]|uniref:TIGR01244 family sulfur transferase n=1 Tax=Tateyamaria omphalii TaxID=299262 RepID=UPI0016761CDE|nr:TIGR01244 family sulfur transferase [Tateyamaria omphalii]GGX55313.1 TIGR01244 family protein [Tateyamaria omphalii]
MDIRQITPTYFVAPQLDPADLPDIAAAGIKTVICNRPDGEVPPALQADAIEAATLAAGLAFHRLPLTHQTMNAENVAQHMALTEDTQTPVLAYCASGTRSTVVWCLGQAGRVPTDDILRTARDGGYDLDGLRPTLDAIAAQSGTARRD